MEVFTHWTNMGCVKNEWFLMIFNDLYSLHFCREVLMNLKITHLDNLGCAILLKMSKFLSKNILKTKKIFFQLFYKLWFPQHFQCGNTMYIFFRIFQCIKKRYPWWNQIWTFINFKNVHFQKVILSSTKKGGIKLDRSF